MRSPARPRLLWASLLLGSIWSGWFLWSAFGRWRFERVCSMTCGPFWEAELIGQLRAAMDWQRPLLLAALPLAALAVWWLARGFTHRKKTRAA